MGWIISTLSLLIRLGRFFFSLLSLITWAMWTIGKRKLLRSHTSREPSLLHTLHNRSEVTEGEEDTYKKLAVAVFERLQDIKPEGNMANALTKVLDLFLGGLSSESEAESLEEAGDNEGSDSSGTEAEAEDNERSDSLRLDFDILEYLFHVTVSFNTDEGTTDEVRDFLNWVAVNIMNIRQTREHSIAGKQARVQQTHPIVGAQASPSGAGWAAIFDLPAELLILILENVYSDDLSFPWKLSHVNRLCRKIALDTPTLWSTIDFEIGIRRVKVHLERSMSAPLTVSARLFAEDDMTILALKEILQHQTHRLRRFQLISSNYEVEEPVQSLLSSLAGQFPVLELLELGFGNFIFSPHTVNLQITDGSIPIFAPALRNLSLRSCTMDDKCQGIPLGSLRTLTLVDVRTSMVALINVLQMAHELENLRIETFSTGSVSDVGVHVEAVTLPKLRNVEFIHIGVPGCLRAAIQAPAAQRVVYRPRSEISRWDSRRLRMLNSVEVQPEPNMPLSNIQTLVSLVLIDYPMDTEGWNKLFHSLPKLEELSLSGCELTGKQLSGLSGEVVDMGLACPSLVFLCIQEEFTLRSAAVLDIVVARTTNANEGSSSIRRVQLRQWLSSNIEPADIEAIAGMVEECVVDVMDDEYDSENESEVDNGSTASDTSSKDSWYYEYEYESSGSDSEGSVSVQ